MARMGCSRRLLPAAPPPLLGPPAVPPPAVGDPAAPRLILCGGGWWWDGGVCEELDDEDMAGGAAPSGSRSPAGEGPERCPRRPACTGRGGGGEGGGGTGAALPGPGESPRRRPAAPGASYRRPLPRQAPAIAARPSVVGTGGAAESRGRSHRTARPAHSGRRRGATRARGGGGTGGEGEGEAFAASSSFRPLPATGSRREHHPLPAPPHRRMAARSPDARPRRVGAGDTHAPWAAPPRQRWFYCSALPSLYAFNQSKGSDAQRGVGRYGGAGCGKWDVAALREAGSVRGGAGRSVGPVGGGGPRVPCGGVEGAVGGRRGFF